MPNWISTTRLAQVSGDFDPDGLPHFEDSGAIGIDGIDLGASVVHGETTYVYFGDVIPDPDRQRDAVGVIDDILVPAGGAIVAARQHTDITSAFFIDKTGALCVTWVVGGGKWRHALRIGPPGQAVPGGELAVARQLPNQLDVFFIGVDGGLYAAWVFDNHQWQGPTRVTAASVGEAGGCLAAIKQFDNQLDVFFIGQDRKLNVAWVVDGGLWNGPIAIGAPDRPYPRPGSAVAACRQGANQLDVFFIGEDGCLYVAWVSPDIQNSHWQGPQNVSPHGAATSTPGAHLVAFKQRPEQVTVMYLGLDNKLTAMWVVHRPNQPNSDIWQGPAPAVPGSHFGRVNSRLTASVQGAEQWDVFLIGLEGSVDVYWSRAGRPWEGPFPIAPPGRAVAGAGIASVHQLDDQLTVLFSGPDGALEVCWVTWSAPDWKGPVRINPEMFGIRYLIRDGRFWPFTLRGDPTDAARLWTLDHDETPTGAFSHGERVFVYVVAGRERSVSFLSSSARPDLPEPYKFELTFSRGPDPDSGSFLQVAPVVVKTAEIRGLHSAAEEGVILFGHGRARREGPPLRDDCIATDEGRHGIQLAFMPLLAKGGISTAGIQFYRGDGAWSPVEADSRTLVRTCYGWTSVSAGRIPGADKWILLYQLTYGDTEEARRRSIVARIADQPWEVEQAPEIVLFNPDRDQAWDRYMFKSGVADSNRTRPNFGHPAFAYGAFLLHRYTRFNPRTRQATLHYLMSTGRPYQVQLMRSVITV
jgi:hypothetical protein